MGRLEQAKKPAPAPGAAARTTGGGPVVKASPKGFLSRSGPCGSPGGPERRTAQPLMRLARRGWCWGGCCRLGNSRWVGILRGIRRSGVRPP